MAYKKRFIVLLLFSSFKTAIKNTGHFLPTSALLLAVQWCFAMSVWATHLPQLLTLLLRGYRVMPGQTPCVHNALHTTLWRSEEHTSELQSRFDLVCRLLLETKIVQ